MHTILTRQGRPVRRFLGLLLTLTLLLSALPMTGLAVTKEEINGLKSQAAALEKEKADLQKQINAVAASKSNALQQKQLLEQKINVLRSQIAVSEQTIADLTAQIAQKEQELAEAKAEEARYYELFCERVRSMEEDGEVSYWAVLFNSDSFSDFLDQMNTVGEIMDYDQEIRDQLEAARIKVENAKKDLEEAKAEEEQVRAQLNAQKAELETEENQVNALISQLNSQSAAYAGQMEDLQEDADAMAAQISQAERQYAAQIEAQRKAAEAAKQAAAAKAAQEAAAKAAAAKASQGGGQTAAAATTATVTRTGSGGMIWPLSGYTRVSSPFGYRICPFHGRELHGGCDIPAPGGTPIMAAKSGVVVLSTYGSSYGNHVAITHADGTRTMYCHMSSRAVSAGQTVAQGQVIGYVGSTGSSTGNHLHFEVWTGSSSSTRVNPLNYF